jgi:starch phosphorylase
MSHTTTTPEPTSNAIDRHLLATGGAEPDQATAVDMMHAIAQVAREHLSRRWVANEAADRIFSSDRTIAEYARLVWGLTPRTGR